MHRAFFVTSKSSSKFLVPLRTNAMKLISKQAMAIDIVSGAILAIRARMAKIVAPGYRVGGGVVLP